MEMGFHVDVVAGASPENISIDVESVGQIKETWTSLGAAASIMKTWDKTSILLNICFIVIAIFYTINRLYFKLINSKYLIDLLLTLNWNNNHIRKLIHCEFLILQLISLFLSLVLFVLVYDYINDIRIYLLQIVIFFIMLFVTSLFINIKIRKQNLKNKRLNQVKSIPLKNTLYFKKYLIPSFIQVTMLTILLMFMLIQFYSSFRVNNVTLLGEHINQSTLWLQISIVLATVIITLFTVVDYLSNLLIIRKEEFQTLLMIGWKVRHIRKLILKETFLWTISSVLLGYLFVLLYISIYFNSIPIIIYLLPISIVLFISILVFLITHYLLRNLLNKYKEINY